MTNPDRDFRIHFARVNLAEAARRRHSRVNRHFYWTLFASAQKARREAGAMYREPVQASMFGAST